MPVKDIFDVEFVAIIVRIGIMCRNSGRKLKHGMIYGDSVMFENGMKSRLAFSLIIILLLLLQL